MQKKEYVAPAVEELGTLEEFTQNSWMGANSDGQLPEISPEIFGS